METSKIVRWSAIVTVSVFLTTFIVNGDPECDQLLQVFIPTWNGFVCRYPIRPSDKQLLLFCRETIIWHNQRCKMCLTVFEKYLVLFTIRTYYKADWRNEHKPSDLQNCKFSLTCADWNRLSDGWHFLTNCCNRFLFN